MDETKLLDARASRASPGYIGYSENGVLINGVKLVPLYIEVLTRNLCKKPLFSLKVLKNNRFLSQDHEIIKRFYMINTFSLKSLFYFKNRVKPVLLDKNSF